MSDKPMDVLKPWTIKSVPARVADEITEAAPKLGLTNGQLIEKMWELWKGEGQPMAAGNPLSDLTALLNAAGFAAGTTPPPRAVRGLIGDYAKAIRQ